MFKASTCACSSSLSATFLSLCSKVAARLFKFRNNNRGVFLQQRLESQRKIRRMLTGVGCLVGKQRKTTELRKGMLRGYDESQRMKRMMYYYLCCKRGSDQMVDERIVLAARPTMPAASNASMAEGWMESECEPYGGHSSKRGRRLEGFSHAGYGQSLGCKPAASKRCSSSAIFWGN